MKDQVRVIQENMTTEQSQQKRYANIRRRDLTFEEGDRVYIMVSPMKAVKRLGKKGKLSLRYIRPYQIMERVVPMAYRVALSTKYHEVRDVFHVTSLIKTFRAQKPE